MQQLPSTVLKFGLYFFKKQPVAFTIFFLVPVFGVLESNVLPYSLKMIIDAISAANVDRASIFTTIKPAIFLWLGASVLLVLIYRMQNYWQAEAIPKFQADIRMTVLNYVTKHSYQYFSDQFAGSLVNKINDLARTIENIRMIVCWNIINTLAISLTALAIMATINIVFVLIVSIWIIIQAIIVVYKSKAVNKMAAENAEHRSALSGIIVDILSNITSVKLFARQHFEQQYAYKSQEKEQRSNTKVILKINNFRWWLDIPYIIMNMFLFYFLVRFWQLNQISSGDFVFIYTSSGIIINLIWHLSWALPQLFGDIGTAKQALSLIAAPHGIADKPGAADIIVNKGKIEFKDVTFHYKKGTKIFNNKNIVIKPGEKVGLVGYSGSGKSSFVNLILRFFDVESGGILIDDQDISKVTQESLRQNISMIPQDTSLFHRSLLDNIKYGNPDATDTDVITASKTAHCHEFIAKLPEGYNTLVGERGIKLSGGQRQRIAIARAILENAPILILDEATSALDSATEKLIQNSLSVLMQGKTTIVVAHRLSTLLNMDRILVFSNGLIIEDGRHDELLDKGGHYAKLWHMQVGGFLPE